MFWTSQVSACRVSCALWPERASAALEGSVAGTGFDISATGTIFYCLFRGPVHNFSTIPIYRIVPSAQTQWIRREYAPKAPSQRPKPNESGKPETPAWDANAGHWAQRGHTTYVYYPQMPQLHRTRDTYRRSRASIEAREPNYPAHAKPMRRIRGTAHASWPFTARPAPRSLA